MSTYIYMHFMHTSLFIFGCCCCFFRTGICKLEKEILSLQVTGDSSPNWYSELLAEKRMLKENTSFYKLN